jgi:hypothetical protein
MRLWSRSSGANGQRLALPIPNGTKRMYYANADDAEADLTSPIGFEDDVEVLNACLRFARLDELCLNPEDYDDV